MDRREFLRTTGAAAAAATTATAAAASATPQRMPAEAEVAAPAVVKGAHELRLAMPWPDGVAGLPDQARRLAQRITSLSDGRYRIGLVPGAGSGLGAVRAGKADLYFGSEHDHLEAHRSLAYFAGLPGDRGVAPRHLAAWMLVGGGQALWDDLAGDFGVKAMLAGHSGDEACFLATRPIEEMSELAGQRVSVMGLARDVVRGFGLEPAAVDAASLAQVMARGDILAAEWGGAIASHSLGLMAVAPYSAGASINRHGSALSLGMRRSLWDSLSASDQTMFATAAEAGLQLALAEEEAHRRLLYPEPPASKTWPLARELKRAIRRVADAVVAQVAASDGHAQRINAGYVAFRRAVQGEEPQPTDSGSA
jgi:TRAP-type mannitol/chloroaromatic compound transport system substrate-binding protein